MSKYIGGIKSNTSSIVNNFGDPSNLPNCIHCYLFKDPNNLGEDTGSEGINLRFPSDSNDYTSVVNSSDSNGITRSSTLKGLNSLSLNYTVYGIEPVDGNGFGTLTYPFDINELSVSVWHKYNSGFVYRIGDSNPLRYFTFLLFDDEIRFVLDGSNSNPELIKSTVPGLQENDTWYHIVVTFDGSKVRLYVNNNEEVIENGGIFNFAEFEPFIAGDVVRLHYFDLEENDEVDSFAIYNRVLTEEEIDLLYNNDETKKYNNSFISTGINLTVNGNLQLNNSIGLNIGYYDVSSIVPADINVVVALEFGITLTIPDPVEGRLLMVRNLSNGGAITLDCAASGNLFQTGSAITSTQSVASQVGYLFVVMTTTAGTRYVSISSFG
jgi:hypothetical protein